LAAGLEVGVGTGISLPQYAPPSHLWDRHFRRHVTQGQARVANLRLKNVEGLAVMSEKLEFADGSFDVVMAQYVVTAVPIRKPRWTNSRVLRPGGEIILLSRVSADGGSPLIEQRLQPVVRQLVPHDFACRAIQWPPGLTMELSNAGCAIAVRHFVAVTEIPAGRLCRQRTLRNGYRDVRRRHGRRSTSSIREPRRPIGHSATRKSVRSRAGAPRAAAAVRSSGACRIRMTRLSDDSRTRRKRARIVHAASGFGTAVTNIGH